MVVLFYFLFLRSIALLLLRLLFPSSPSNDKVITLENEIKSLRESLQNSEKQNEKNSEEEIIKWRKNVDELKVEIAR